MEGAAPPPQVPRVRLGGQGLEVSKLGFGCMGLTGSYNAPLGDEAVAAVVGHAFRRGVTFFDTSDAYGPHTNETLLGRALQGLPRGQVQVATKFGIVPGAGGLTVCGTPEYVRACCEASLRRLGLGYIDLYYQHRIDTTVPIEDTVGELKKLVEEGKVKYIGLSEASPDTIRRAHAVHPITAVQMEWSLWSRDIEPEIVPLCRELGIGIVPYSPIGRGFFAGRGVTQQVSSESSLQKHPRFVAENLEKNKQIYLKMEDLAKKHHCSPAQLALSWVLHQGDDVAPIPGTTKIKNLDANIDSLKVKLTDEDLKEITSQIRADDVAGGRQYSSYAHTSWKSRTKGKTKAQFSDPRIFQLGFGCFGLTGAYGGSALDDEAAAAVISHAFRRGVTFFDTSDIYGPHHTNEILVGKALKELPREQVQVATKFGLSRGASGALAVCGRPEYVRACCEASLRRLGVDCIDLYYQHRVDTTIPIEDTVSASANHSLLSLFPRPAHVGELKKLVEEGKVKHIGLSEASPDTIRRAHAVHPVTAVQMEWSLWSRDIEPEIVPLCR
ncbi:hypothetical protein HU200_047518 [Digitaria exilis]|uniref:NADP-dependent oxidoreductase domain-containing protein n=1 Tax=Digitaria exilis TaxID=1010633 RepID=A0A835AUY1_9POAL|nr:hypothetical protein HU200_047518 [Digitaria exilis]